MLHFYLTQFNYAPGAMLHHKSMGLLEEAVHSRKYVPSVSPSLKAHQILNPTTPKHSCGLVVVSASTTRWNNNVWLWNITTSHKKREWLSWGSDWAEWHTATSDISTQMYKVRNDRVLVSEDIRIQQQTDEVENTSPWRLEHLLKTV